MSKKQSTEIINVMSDETLALLKDSYPVETGFQRAFLPRLGFYSQDQVEGKGKSMKVITEAGTFFTERQSDELDEKGKKKWIKEEIGTSVEVGIFFRRKQLKFYDGVSYTSSPVYDEDDQIIPLFKDKAEVDRGTPAELKSRPIYKGKSAKGKDISKLEDNRVLYVLYKNEVYQMNVRGTSMYAFMSYSKNTIPSTVLTKISSESKENGAIAWNQMIFEVVRKLYEEEAREILSKVREVESAIKNEKEFFASQQPQTEEQKQIAKESKDF